VIDEIECIIINVINWKTNRASARKIPKSDLIKLVFVVVVIT